MFFAVWKSDPGARGQASKAVSRWGPVGLAWSPGIGTAPHIVPEVTAGELHEIQGGLRRLGSWDRLQKK
ncbi:hypothetical protein EYF80_065085 [Liparis tanakae]|uniref:Uncharacterized protein n=1 Tax=Liparis tanakae TaxID=230148 RepID=A0A4Z2E7M4_9TELE|nr:hypothetical protein EYF80_065085 [Liparis tanakae]